MIEQLTNHLWQSTVFGLAIAALTIFFRECRAHVRYWLWFSASIKFFVPFAMLIALGRQLEWAPAVREATPPVVSTAVVRISEPFFGNEPNANLPAPRSNGPAIQRLETVLPAVWVCGCLAVVLVRIRLWWRIRAVVSAGTSLELPGVGIPSGIQVRSTTELLEPGVVGLWRPALLVPAGLERDLTPSQLRAVIAHEVTHIRRHDNLTATIHMLAEALFWFHPLVWWVGSRLVQERERACDEAVLGQLGEPDAYAEGILVVCKRYVETPLSCVSGVSGSNIKKRIEGIMNNRIGMRLSFARIAVLTLATLFAFAVPIVVGSMTAALPRPSMRTAPASSSMEAAVPQPVQPPAVVQSSQGTNPQTDKPAAPAPAAATPKAEFEEASIRQCDPNNRPAAPEGMRGGGANSFQLTPGRTHALCMTLATLIRTAYNYGPADLEFMNPSGGAGRGFAFNNVYGLGVEDGVRVRGGPDWVRSDRFSIEAIANGASDPATMRGPMLRALLERRFQLKAHIETEQIPAFALAVDRRGLNIKPVAEGACDRLPPPTPGVPNIIRPRRFADVRRGEKPSCGVQIQRNGPNQVVVGGEATLASLRMPLGLVLGSVQVLDKTDSADKFNFILEFVIDDNTPGSGRLFTPSDAEQADVPRAATIFTALQEQLGLRLEPAKAPREFLVIDHVERLSPN
jgi:uncharacterized protein (TIGR03435 family)